jgi:hypothetical protein
MMHDISFEITKANDHLKDPPYTRLESFINRIIIVCHLHLEIKIRIFYNSKIFLKVQVLKMMINIVSDARTIISNIQYLKTCSNKKITWSIK